LLGAMDGSIESPVGQTLPMELVLRESCAPPVVFERAFAIKGGG